MRKRNTNKKKIIGIVDWLLIGLMIGVGLTIGLIIGVGLTLYTVIQLQQPSFLIKPFVELQKSSPELQEEIDQQNAQIVELQKSSPETEVIVALQTIAPGFEFKVGSIGRRDWPANNVPSNVIADEAETIGQVAATFIEPGQIIVRSMLVSRVELEPGEAIQNYERYLEFAPNAPDREAMLASIEGLKSLPEGCPSDCSYANLSGVNLSGAYLSGVNLSEVDLSGANLSRAYLSGANLSGADLNGTDLNGANLSGANLYDANLSGANLNGAYLGGAHLRGANLREADLSGADLSRAYLNGANLGGANLDGVNLDGASLGRANLSQADLSGTVFLLYASLNGATYDKATTWPDGFSPEEAGAKLDE